MSKQYYRRKKSRDLKRKSDLFDTSDEDVSEMKKNKHGNGNNDVADPISLSLSDQADISQTPENHCVLSTDTSAKSNLSTSNIIDSSPFQNTRENNNSIFSASSICHDSHTENSSLLEIGEESDVLPVNDNESSACKNEVEQCCATHNNMEDKLRAWTLKNIGTLRLSVVSELLVLMRSEGYVSLPKTAQTLLGTTHSQTVQPMLSNRGTMCEYLYLGIENGLKKRIISDIYDEDIILILVHIDGVQIYKNSRQQFWPILVKVYNDKYEISPFIAAIYKGDSKPKSASEFMQDFVTEAAHLICNGILINNKRYSFGIKAIVADAPARSFIKSCKGHNGFYACERCETKGVTVNKKRVYPEMNARKRSRKSFKKKRQSEHHLLDRRSALLDIPKFDPVLSVILDSMHLLFIGVLKLILEKLINRSSASRITLTQLRLLQKLMKSLTSDIPKEFQRKVFDLEDFAHWKATQFRFFLLYCGPLILRHILPEDYYKHFLLLFVACRILCSSQLAVAKVDYANELLRKFFFLLPSFYGADSQVINMHNLIHVSEDVKNMQAPLSNFSAFWGENYIGELKKYVKSRNKPLVQVVNRLSELESCDSVKIRRRFMISECVLEKDCEIREHQQRKFITARRVRIKDVSLSSAHPDNVVLLKNRTIFRISRILVQKNNTGRNPEKACQIYFEGHEVKRENCKSIFDNPLLSEEIGVMRVKRFSHDLQLRCADEIDTKIVLMKIKKKKYAVTLLHYA